MKIIHGSESSFNDLINDDLVLVDFFATWCGPCKMLGPVLEELSEERESVKIVKIDVDECSSIARSFGIMSVPTLVLFKNGEELKRMTGYTSKDVLVDWIEN